MNNILIFGNGYIIYSSENNDLIVIKTFENY